MATRSRADNAKVSKSAALVIERLDTRIGEITRFVQEMLVTELAEVVGEGELADLVHDAVQGNFDTFFPAVRHGIAIDHIEPPPAALEHARRMAQRGVAADALVRGYRLAHQAFVGIVLDEIRNASLAAKLSLDVFEQVTTMSFSYIDRISQQLMAEYQNERDQWLANENRMRALRVRELLGTGEIDVDETTIAIGYPLRRLHLSVIVWSEQEAADGLAAMERYVAQLAESLGAGERPLFVAADRATGWAWIPVPDDGAEDALSRLRTFTGAHPHGPRIAAGSPLWGLAGFRRSHHKALTIRAVVAAMGPHAENVVAASDPGLAVAARFRDDLPEARNWVGEVLGPLAGINEADERLRETLRVFLRSGSSFKDTAEELHLHVNSVKYRVKRAVERRGRPIGKDRLDVEVALLLCHFFDTAVLS
jgi:sugar diacid utilization regulator